jgi:CBS domain-containing protein
MPATTLVRDVMTKEVATLSPDLPVAEAADRLAAARYGAMPVVAADGRLLGLLRDEDLIVSEARLHVPTMLNVLGLTLALPGEMKRFEGELHKVAGASVGEVMQSDPRTIGEDASLEELATVMHEHDATHLPVVDAQGQLVGIVARGDLVRFIARTT